MIFMGWIIVGFEHHLQAIGMKVAGPQGSVAPVGAGLPDQLCVCRALGLFSDR
jgi:hypothetical protein